MAAVNKIAHLVYTPRFSGAELLVARLADIHARGGTRTRVISLNPEEENFNCVMEDQACKGVEWVRPKKVLGKWERLKMVRSAIEEFQPDALFAHSVIPAAYARLCSRKVISVLHDASEDDYRSWKFSIVERVLRRRSIHVIAVSEAGRNNYVRRFPHAKATVVKNGIELHRFRNLDPDAGRAWRKEHGVGPNQRVLLQVGRYSRVKQQHKTLDALLTMLVSDSSLTLVFAGAIEDQAFFSTLRERCSASVASERILLLKPTARVEDLLSAADVYLMPSAHEAHSLAMLEALSSGRPIVASRIGSFDFIEDFSGTWRVDPDDQTSYRDAVVHALTSNHGVYARALDQFSIERTAAAYLELAQSCTS